MREGAAGGAGPYCVSDGMRGKGACSIHKLQYLYHKLSISDGMRGKGACRAGTAARAPSGHEGPFRPGDTTEEGRLAHTNPHPRALGPPQAGPYGQKCDHVEATTHLRQLSASKGASSRSFDS